MARQKSSRYARSKRRRQRRKKGRQERRRRMTGKDPQQNLRMEFPGYHLEPETKFLTDAATVARILATVENSRPFTPLPVQRDERTNYYWDTNKFRLFREGLECRSRKANDGVGYRNDLKTSEDGREGPIGPDEDGIFLRREYNSASKKDTPDLSDFDIVGKGLEDKKLVPWVKGYFQRKRFTFSPTGYPDSKVEISLENGYYQTMNNKHRSVEMWIVELELKKGSEQALVSAAQELKTRYGLTVCAKTKGEMGFEFASQFMDDEHKESFTEAVEEREERYTDLRRTSRVQIATDPLFPKV
jgi:inorganic triphosphatase YgiF